MPQTITELTLLTPSPDNYILYHHVIKNKNYFSLKSKDNLRSHFVFKKLELISINQVVFQTAIELINAFNQTFNSNLNGPDYNKITKSTGFQLLGNVLTVNSGWEWLISNFEHYNEQDVVTTIPFSATGKSRIEYIIPNNSNGFTRVPGPESETILVAPELAFEDMYVTYFVVSDSVIEPPADPNLGGRFIPKLSPMPFERLLAYVKEDGTIGRLLRVVYPDLNEIAHVKGVNAPIQQQIDILKNLQDLNTNVTSQAYASWTGVGFVYDVIYPDYYIQGVLYPSGTEQITLDVSDGTNPRQDLIALNNTGAIKVTGIPEVNPLVPTINPEDTIIITTILVPANATTPEITEEIVYKEDVEWGTFTNISEVTLDSTDNPFSGTKCIDSFGFSHGFTGATKYILFVADSTKKLTDYNILKFRINLKSGLGSGSFLLRLYNGSTLVSKSVYLTDGSYNFNNSLFDTYQQVIIPISSFISTDITFDRLEIAVRSSSTLGYKLDNIIFSQENIEISPLQKNITSIVTDDGVANATTHDDVITFNSANSELLISAIGKVITFTSLFTSALKGYYDSAYTWVTTNGANVVAHLSRADNPHGVTKTQVGLGNVDNTSDANKPVSTAQATADGVVLSTANAYTDSRVASVYVYKGNVADYAALPGSGQTIGWVWNLLDTGANYAWTGTVWDELGATVDISGKENTSNKTATVVGNESSTSLYLNILGAVTYFQQKFTDSSLGTFIIGLTAKATPIDADSIAIVDSADSNKAKKTTFTQLKAFLKSYFDTIYTSLTAVKVPNTYFINTATGNNATGVFEDASKPFATIDYVFANFTLTQGVIIFLQGTGQTFAMTGQFQSVNQNIVADESSTNILDFSSNTNTYAKNSGALALITVNMPNGVIRNERSGGTGIIFSLGLGRNTNTNFNVKEIYWNCSTNMTQSTSLANKLQADKISSRVQLCQGISNDIIIQEFVCLASGATLAQYAKNTTINLISGTGSYILCDSNGSGSPRHIITDVTATGGLTWGGFGDIDVTFNNSTITTFNLQGNSSLKTIRGNIKSITSISGSINSTKFINFTANLGTGNMTLGSSNATVSFENCSIKSTNSPIIITAGAFSNVLELKNSAFEVVNAVPLVTGGAGGTNTLKIAGVSTNATMLSDQNGTGVTVNVIGKNSVADGVDSKDAVNKGQLDAVNTKVSQYNTYFINTATGNNATGVFEDASKPFATIDYVNANFTIADGTIFYLQGTGQTYAINNQLQIASQSFIADDTSTNTLDFSGNSNTNISATQSTKNYIISITMRSGFVRNNRSGGTGVNLNGLASFFTLNLDVREIYWNTSTLMYSINPNSHRGTFKVDSVACAKVLTNFFSEYLHVRAFVCLSTNAMLLQTQSNGWKCNIRIDNIYGTGSYLFSTNDNYIVGDISTTVACGFDTAWGQESYITFNNSVITGGGIVLPTSANNLVLSGVIRSVTSFTNLTTTSAIFKFINFTANFGTNKLNVNGTATISFENCSIKSTNSPLGVVTNVSGGNFIIKNSTFEVVNAVPLMTGGAGGTRTLKIAGVSTNATMLSDQNGTGVTVTQYTNY